MLWSSFILVYDISSSDVYYLFSPFLLFFTFLFFFFINIFVNSINFSYSPYVVNNFMLFFKSNLPFPLDFFFLNEVLGLSYYGCNNYGIEEWTNGSI
jgi:hypothetical protein